MVPTTDRVSGLLFSCPQETRTCRFDLFGPAQSTVGYTTTGEADDWLYGKMGIISMTPEVPTKSLAKT